MKLKLVAVLVGLLVVGSVVLLASRTSTKRQDCAQQVIEAVNSFDTAGADVLQRFNDATASLASQCGDVESELSSLLRRDRFDAQSSED